MRGQRTILAALAVVGYGANYVTGFYLPGVPSVAYQVNDPVQVNVNSLTPKSSSQSQQLKAIVPYDFYNDRFHFCVPPEGKIAQTEGLGSAFLGDRIFNSAFKVTNRGFCSVAG